MSALARKLAGGAAELITASGTLTGNGSLTIPAGVTLVSLTGRGGTGGDNGYYDPGQPYIAPNHYWQNISYWNDMPNPPGPSPASNPNSLGIGTIEYVAAPGATGPAGWSVQGTDGQPYIAPNSGGGVYSGTSTTATLNGITDTWAGGSGGAAASSVQTLTSTGLGQTLTYSIGSGGSLSYSYQY